VKPQHINIKMPHLSQQAAYELVCWLECLTHDIGLYYSDEVRSELNRREIEADEDFDDDMIPF